MKKTIVTIVLLLPLFLKAQELEVKMPCTECIEETEYKIKLKNTNKVPITVDFEISDANANISDNKTQVTLTADEAKEIVLKIKDDGNKDILKPLKLTFKVTEPETGHVKDYTEDIFIESKDKPEESLLRRTVLTYFTTKSGGGLQTIIGGNLKMGGRTIFESFYGEMSFDVRFKSLFGMKKKLNLYGGAFSSSLTYADVNESNPTIKYLVNPKETVLLSGSTKQIEEKLNVINKNELNNISGLLFLGQDVTNSESDFKLTPGIFVDYSFASMKLKSEIKSLSSDTTSISKEDSSIYVTYPEARKRDLHFSRNDTISFFNPNVTIGVASKLQYENDAFGFFLFNTTGYTTLRAGDYYADGGGLKRIGDSRSGKAKSPGLNYLVRFQLKEKLTKLGLSIGAEIRGLYGPNTRPLMMFYAGTNISLENLFK